MMVRKVAQQRGFTFVELLLVLAITMLVVTLSTAYIVRIGEQQSLERYAHYFEMKLREAQMFAIEHNVVVYLRFLNEGREFEYAYIDQQNKRYLLYEAQLPSFVTEVAFLSAVPTTSFSISPNNGTVSQGLTTIRFRTATQTIIYQMGLERGKMWRNE